MSCCVGMCCRESSWLGVCRMLRDEGLAVTADGTLVKYSGSVTCDHYGSLLMA